MSPGARHQRGALQRRTDLSGSHCGALNVFPGMSVNMAFICRECGEGVDVTRSVQ